MSLSVTLYNTIFKRTSTFALAIISGTFLFERGFDSAADLLFRTINKGKLWEDIKPQE